MKKLIPLLLLLVAGQEPNDVLLGVVAVGTADGVEIAFVVPESPADKSKLKAGDRILKIESTKIRTSARSRRSATPSAQVATKKSRQPAAASAGATLSTPRP